MTDGEQQPLPYGRQDVDQADVDAVVEVLRSDFLTQGPVVAGFEQAVADRCDVDHAVAVNSATSALHLACLALGVGPGDEVWISTNTFVASANCARLCGAEVRFIDIDAHTWNLCPLSMERELLAARRDGRQLPKVVIAVHFAGEPCEMERLSQLAIEFGFRLIEDAAHAFGARYRGSPVGACRHSDITVFSFHPVKIMTSAEGGVATTRDGYIAARLKLLRTHGVHRDVALSGDEPWRYEQRELGLNYRMSDVHAALGLSQSARVDTFLAQRHRLAERYDRLLGPWPLTLPVRARDARSALHLYPVLVDDDSRDGTVRRRVFNAMRAQGIGVNVHYIPVHTQPYYRARESVNPVVLPVAERYYARCLSLPLFGTMTISEQDRVIEALRHSLAPELGSTAAQCPSPLAEGTSIQRAA